MLLSHLSQPHNLQEQLHVKRKYTKIPIEKFIPAEPSAVLTERKNGGGVPSVGRVNTIMFSSSDPSPSDVVYVASS